MESSKYVDTICNVKMRMLNVELMLFAKICFSIIATFIHEYSKNDNSLRDLVLKFI